MSNRLDYRTGLTFCRSCRQRQLTEASIVSANCSTKLVKGQRGLSWESIRMNMGIKLHAKGMTLDLKVDLPFFTIMLLKSWCPHPIPSRFRYLKRNNAQVLCFVQIPRLCAFNVFMKSFVNSVLYWYIRLCIKHDQRRLGTCL